MHPHVVQFKEVLKLADLLPCKHNASSLLELIKCSTQFTLVWENLFYIRQVYKSLPLSPILEQDYFAYFRSTMSVKKRSVSANLALMSQCSLKCADSYGMHPPDLDGFKKLKCHFLSVSSLRC